MNYVIITYFNIKVWPFIAVSVLYIQYYIHKTFSLSPRTPTYNQDKDKCRYSMKSDTNLSYQQTNKLSIKSIKLSQVSMRIMRRD